MAASTVPGAMPAPKPAGSSASQVSLVTALPCPAAHLFLPGLFLRISSQHAAVGTAVWLFLLYPLALVLL